MSKKTVFVSYSSKDKIFVNDIVDELEAMGITCWKAPEHIPAGSSYAREIPRAIANCEVFLLMLSKTSQDSIWVEKEIDNAITNRRNIIPFVLDGAPLNDAFRFYLNNIQMISYHDNKKDAMEELKGQLSLLILDKEYRKDDIERKEEKKDTKLKEVKETIDDKTQVVINKKMSINPAKGSVLAKKQQSNALRVNRVPVECQYCGSRKLNNVTLGTYRCEECGRDNYDDFQTIRNYLNKAGSASALVIEKNTGVPRKIINYFFQEEYLEISDNSLATVPCASCGTPIRTGMYCDACKRKKGIRSGSGKSMSLHGSWYT